MGDENIKPYGIMILFMSLAYVGASVDSSGIFAYLALKITYLWVAAVKACGTMHVGWKALVHGNACVLGAGKGGLPRRAGAVPGTGAESSRTRNKTWHAPHPHSHEHAPYMLRRAKGHGRALFMFYFLLSSFITTFTSNDVCIVTLTPIM